MNQQTALAKSLLDRGYAIFPVVPGFKFPANTNGFLEASSDTLTALPWFSGARRNIGIATGDASGVVVIDLDLYKPECAVNYNELCDRLGYLPKTFTVQTRAGGQHLYFRKPEGYFSTALGLLLSLYAIGPQEPVAVELRASLAGQMQ